MRRSRPSIDCVGAEGYDHSYYFIATFIGEHLRRITRKRCRDGIYNSSNFRTPLCEKARWALDFKGVPFTRVSLFPGWHIRVVRKLAHRTPPCPCSSMATRPSRAPARS